MLSAMDAAKPDFEMDERDQPQWCNWYRSLTTHDANGTIRHAGDEWPGQSGCALAAPDLKRGSEAAQASADSTGMSVFGPSFTASILPAAIKS